MIGFYTRVGDRFLEIDPGFFQFSAGEWHFNAEPNTFVGNEIAWIDGRVDANDYIKLLMWHDVVITQGGRGTIFIPYLPAARADKGTPRGFDIYGNLLSQIRDDFKIVTLDAHSDYSITVLRAMGLNVKNVLISDIPGDIFENNFRDYDGVIAPDEGAEKRARAFAARLGDNTPVYVARKQRELSTGYITGYEAPDLPSDFGHYLAVDDICDGGKTFEILSNSLRKTKSCSLDLFVTHGIFSKGFGELSKRYVSIYTANPMYDRERINLDLHRVYNINIKNELMKEYAV